MGGYGSGWQGARKATVESSLVLDAALLRRKAAGSRITGSLIWGARAAPSAIINYEADLTPGNAWIRLHYQRNGELLDYKIRLVSTRPTYGGLRWWFICPSRRPDGERRAAWPSSISRPAASISAAARATGSPTGHARRAGRTASSSPPSSPRRE